MDWRSSAPASIRSSPLVASMAAGESAPMKKTAVVRRKSAVPTSRAAESLPR